ncbi:MAG: hypothetical protein K2H91_05055, partial [Lachnospiraceae bacterium]|nr:hypothetical protein [Lachnospiraceae bacterium]
MLEHIYTNILGNTDILFQKYHKWFENKTEKEEDLELFILLQEDLFSDMIFEKGSTTGDYMLRNGKHLTFETELSIDEQYFRFIVEHVAKYDAYTDVNSRKIVVDIEHINNKPTILHEMLHAHEFILQKRKPLLKEIVLLELYKDLKPKLSQRNIDIDTWIFNHANIPHNEELAVAGGEHDLLFFLKSIDLDIRCGFELLTVFGYDYTRNFKELG